MTLIPALLLLAYLAIGGLRPPGHEARAAEAEPDLSSARSAALAWIDASWRGDATAANKVLVDDAEQRAFAADALRFSAALRRLEAASVERFGDAGKRVTGYPDGSAAAVAKQLEVRTEGDRATATLNRAPLPLRVLRVDGRWRVDLSAALRDPRVRDVGRRSRTAAEVADAVAREIAAGRFATVDEAAAAFKARRLATVPTTGQTRPAP